MYNTDERSTMCGGDYTTPKQRCACSDNFVESSETACSNNGCGTGVSGNGWGLTSYPLASVYSPLQNFDNLYDCETALMRGTIFRELDLPFICGGMSGGVYRA